MSVRLLYRKIPASERICSYYRCQKPILRNIDRDDNGCIYHHGCLMQAQDEHWRCQECYLVFDATEASLQRKQSTDDYGDKLQVACPECGCTSLRRVSSA